MRVFELPAANVVAKKGGGVTLKDVPMWDSPVIIAPRGAITLVRDWRASSTRAVRGVDGEVRTWVR